MAKKSKKCPHCGLTSTLPIAYGHMPNETHEKNRELKEWVWGGCKYGAIGTDYCGDCGKNFGEVISYDNGGKKYTIEELQSEIIDMNAKQAIEEIKDDIKNLLRKFRPFIGLSNAKPKQSNS